MIVAGSDDDMLRLVAVIDHQRLELDRIRAEAASQSVIAMARGVLMERLGLSSAEAANQLARLATATGVPTAEMAAAVLSPAASTGTDVTGDDPAPGSGDPSGPPRLAAPSRPPLRPYSPRPAAGVTPAPAARYRRTSM